MIKSLFASKSMLMGLIVIIVFITSLDLKHTKASAEIRRGWFFYPDKKCTLIIDKANNSAITGELQQSTGICKNREKGYYFKDSEQEFATVLDSGMWQDIKYNGEPFDYSEIYKRKNYEVLLYAFVTNSKENITGKTMHVAPTKLTVYKSANSKSKKVTFVKRYKTVKVKSTNGSWAKVKVNDKTGWVARKYLVSKVTVAEVKKVVTKYKVENWTSEQIPVGKTIQEAKGENGLKYVYYHTKYKNGKIVSKKKKIWTQVENYVQNEINVTGVKGDLNN